MWQSADPAFTKGEYLPVMPTKEEERNKFTKDPLGYWKENLAGMGGVYNSPNLGVYTYSHNSPIVMKDPDGNATLQVGLSGSATSFLGLSGEAGVAVSFSFKSGFQFGTYTVAPTFNGKIIPSGHSDAGASGAINFTVSGNETLSGLKGEAVTIGTTADAGLAVTIATGGLPSPQIGGAVNIPKDPKGKNSYTFSLGLSYSLSPIDQSITPNNTDIGD